MHKLNLCTPALMASIHSHLGNTEQVLRWVNRKDFEIIGDKLANQIIHGPGGQNKEILDRVRHVWQPVDIFNMRNLVKRYIDLGLMNDAEEIFEEISRLVINRDWMSHNYFIVGYTITGDLNAAEKWMKRMNDARIQMDAYSFKAVLIAYLKFGKPESAMEFFDTMGSKQLFYYPNFVQAIINQACVSGYIDFAEKVFEIGSNFSNLGPVVNQLIIALCKQERLDKALELVERELSDFASTYDFKCMNYLVDALVKKGMIEEAESIIERVSGKADVAPAYYPIIEYYVKIGEMEKAEKWYQTVSKCIPDICILMVNAYLQFGDLQKARDVFDRFNNVKKFNAINNYNMMIKACVRSGHLSLAAEYLKIMKQENISPDANTYVAFVEKMEQDGKKEEAQKLLRVLQGRGIEMEQFKHLY